MSDPCETAWAAGFFDGEGCTTFSDRYLYMQLKQVDEENIRRFHWAVGGLGTIYGPVVSKVETRKPIFVWRAHGRVAIEVKEILWLWLGTAKREQWDRCFVRWDEVRRMRTHCRRGHEFTEDNIYRDKRSPNSRTCLTCRREQERLRYWRKKAIAA